MKPTKAITHSASRPRAKPARRADGERTRLSTDAWIDAALDTIAEQGVAAVAVEPLARALGVTKGSFYWHFVSRDALIEAALKRWEGEDAEGLMREVDRLADPRDRLLDLFRRISGEMRSHVIYSALLGALDHPAVKPVMQRLSQRRIQYLAVAFRAIGLDRRAALNRARLSYSAYVGFLQLILQLKLQRIERADFDAYVEHVSATLIPPLHT